MLGDFRGLVYQESLYNRENAPGRKGRTGDFYAWKMLYL